MCRHCHKDNSWLNVKRNRCENFLETSVTDISHSGCLTKGTIRQWVVSNFNKQHKSRPNTCGHVKLRGHTMSFQGDFHNIVACKHRCILACHFSPPRVCLCSQTNKIACPLSFARAWLLCLLFHLSLEIRDYWWSMIHSYPSLVAFR